jgi:ectoine hydroxylase-related dioxygenase (phytanoyl-CoA dioxygenase family)
MYSSTPYKISYNTNEFPFRKIISKMMGVSQLENLHQLKDYDILIREKDQSTDWHKKYYENFKNKFLPTYLNLIKYLKLNFNYNEIIYQSIPTFRIQLANGNLAVGEWHKDKAYNHGITEVNFWMPFMDTNEYNTIWMESIEDKGDYKPYCVKYGEILIFNGANLYHGNKNNITTETRVSIDFRLVDPKKFIPNDNESINMKTKFNIGQYFEKL